MKYRGPGALPLAWAYALARYQSDASSVERALRLEALVLVDDVRAALGRLGVDCVLDVGAHAGEYGVALRRAGYRGRIVSFEPQPAPYEDLSRLARGDSGWSVHPYALGAIDGELTLELRAVNVFTSFRQTTAFAERRFGRQVASAGTVQVPVRRLASVLDDIDEAAAAQRLFLKMDTQGYDLEVFSGAEDVLPRIVGLQSELSMVALYEGAPTWRDAIARYEAAGFVMSALTPVSHDDITGALVEMDCMMVRPIAGEQRNG